MHSAHEQFLFSFIKQHSEYTLKRFASSSKHSDGGAKLAENIASMKFCIYKLYVWFDFFMEIKLNEAPSLLETKSELDVFLLSFHRNEKKNNELNKP